MNETAGRPNLDGVGVMPTGSRNEPPHTENSPLFFLRTIVATAAGMCLVVLWSAGVTLPSAVIDGLPDALIGAAIAFAAILIARASARQIRLPMRPAADALRF